MHSGHQKLIELNFSLMVSAVKLVDFWGKLWDQYEIKKFVLYLEVVLY